MDFGLAREAPASVKKGESITRAGTILGSVLYMSPEQIEPDPARRLDHACDIYSLGCVGYHLLSGRPPFVGDSLPAIFYGHLQRTAPPLHRVVPEVPVPLADAIAKAMSKRPADRFRSMAQFRKALESAVRLSPPGPGVLIDPVTAPVEPAPVPPDETPTPEPSVPPPAPPDPPVVAESAAPPAPPGEATPPIEPEVDPRRFEETMPVAEPQPEPEPEPEPEQQPPQPPQPKPEPTSRSHLTASRLGLRAKGAIEHGDAMTPADRPRLVEVGSVPGVVYESATAGSTQVVWQPLTADLRPNGAAHTLTRSPLSALRPAVATRPDGLMIAWADTREGYGRTQIRTAAFSARGERRGAEHVVSSTGLLDSPCAAVLSNGCQLVAWHEIAAEPRIHFVLCSEDGEILSGPRRLGAGAFPTVASSGDGTVIAWHRPDQVIEVRPAGQPAGPPAQTIEAAAFPTLVPAGDGFAMAWWSGEPSPGIRLARLSADGRLVGESIRLGDASGTPEPPALVANSAGFVAAWSTPSPDGGPEQALVAVFVDSDLGPPTPAASLARGHRFHPSVLGSGSGAIVASGIAGVWGGRRIGLQRLAIEASA